jgi:Flp pilus assembly protein TadB
MSKYADFAFCIGLMLVIFVGGCTFMVARLEYNARVEEHSERVKDAREFYEEHCRDTKSIAGMRPLVRDALTEECHRAKHAAFDDPAQRALHEVLSRWSVCDASGCSALMDRFGRYFAIFSFVLALVVGAISVELLRRSSNRRFRESLPEAVRNK